MAKRIYTPGRKSDEDMESVGKATGRMCRANRTGKRGTYSAENREERHAGNGSVRSKRFVLHTDGRRRASYFRSTDARQENEWIQARFCADIKWKKEWCLGENNGKGDQ